MEENLIVEKREAIVKALRTGTESPELASKQKEDPFLEYFAYGDQIRRPPYPFEQLTAMAEVHPIHYAAINQKVCDVIGKGFDLEPGEGADPLQYRSIINWWEGLFDEHDSIEVLQAMWEDFETIGWGTLELARDEQGKIGSIYYIPAHTLRVCKDENLLVQIKAGSVVYFRRWTPSSHLDNKKYSMTNGEEVPENTPSEHICNEVMIISRLCRWSLHYGIPGYVSGIAAITQAVAIRDYNILLFDNYREPRHLIFISGPDIDSEQISEELNQIWEDQLSKNPLSNIIMAIGSQAQVTIEPLSPPNEENLMVQLMNSIDRQILIAHRMPPERLGISAEGFFGSHTPEQNQIYRTSVVRNSQSLLESRLNKFIKAEFPLYADNEEVTYKVNIGDMEVLDKEMDRAAILDLAQAEIISINTAKRKLGEPECPRMGDMTVLEWQAHLETLRSDREWEREDYLKALEEEAAAAGEGGGGGDMGF